MTALKAEMAALTADGQPIDVDLAAEFAESCRNLDSQIASITKLKRLIRRTQQEQAKLAQRHRAAKMNLRIAQAQVEKERLAEMSRENAAPPSLTPLRKKKRSTLIFQ